MDYQYAFRQAQRDRLEDVGVVQYRPADGFRVQAANRRSPVSATFRFALAVLASIFTK